MEKLFIDNKTKASYSKEVTSKRLRNYARQLRRKGDCIGEKIICKNYFLGDGGCNVALQQSFRGSTDGAGSDVGIRCVFHFRTFR